MTGTLIEAKNYLAAGQTKEARLAERAEISAHEARAWQQRAMSAIRAGDDVVAKDALLRKCEHQRNAEHFRVLQLRQHREVENLTSALAALEGASRGTNEGGPLNRPLAKTTPIERKKIASPRLYAALSGQTRTKR